MDQQTSSILEFPALKALLEPHVRTPRGRRELAELAPGTDAGLIERRKLLAAEALRHHQEGGRLGPSSPDDPDPILARLAPEGAVLDAGEISRLIAVLHAAGAVRAELSVSRDRYPGLWRLASGIPDLRGVTGPIAGRISADGRLEDSASPALARLRRRLSELESNLQRSLQVILDRSARQGLLQDSYVTVRNGRFVIPVRAEARTTVRGVVHGASSTGSTVFVEPLETLEINNDLVTARDEEQAEIRRILADWSDLLRSRLDGIHAACRIAGEIDLLGAIAVFGVRHRCCISSTPGAAGAGPARVTLLEARHPLLEAGLGARGAEIVPLSVEIPADGGVLVLSGPNAGGKTVALKTIGLLALMNQAGLPVPAREALLPVFNRILGDIGDHQSILESLSTFSARMVRVAGMIEALDTPALILLDEVGAGTDPREAGALAVAIVDHFRRRGACVVATTHHDALKSYAAVSAGAINAAMEIDPATMRPTFRLRSGLSGESGGIDLAERVGLPAGIVEDARDRLSRGDRESLEYAESLRRGAERQQEELETLQRQRVEAQESRAALEAGMRREVEALRAAWRASIEEALASIEKAREELISRIEDRAVALQIRSESRRQTRELRLRMERAVAPPAEPGEPPVAGSPPPRLAPGQRVRIAGIGGSTDTAILESIDARGRAAVLVRGKRVMVRVADLQPAQSAPADEARRAWTLPQGVRFQRRRAQEVPAEINLIGATADEASDRLDKFLDEAYLAGHATVRIVHGHGTGRLRDAVRRLLGGHPHVASHAAADERSGGEGATVATLKD
ncbi:MAG TPA: Smr/MutS family protein [Candidatus Polarisedimenticolia bacterium]|nr:Smr/MutS family protein [Candidatus Polarisedimenticolia bacterium]